MSEKRKVYNIIFVIGLPGSGKTTYANNFAKTNPNTIVLDDLSLNPKLIESVDPEIHKNIVITDPNLCNVTQAAMRESCHKFWPDATGFIYRFIYFENNLDACLKNRQNDPRPGGTEVFTRRLSAKYLIPEGFEVLPVWQKEKS